MHKQPEYLVINRYGQVPALVHGERTVCQSNVILNYLGETLGKFRGEGESQRWRALEWLAWEADRLLPGVGRTRFFTRFMKPDPAVADYFRKAAEAGIKVLDASLAATPFLVGERPTIADIGCYAPLAYAGEGNIDLAEWPNVHAWMGRVAALPGYKAPYDLMPQANAA
jgi:glutathione S-transferase